MYLSVPLVVIPFGDASLPVTFNVISRKLKFLKPTDGNGGLYSIPYNTIDTDVTRR